VHLWGGIEMLAENISSGVLNEDLERVEGTYLQEVQRMVKRIIELAVVHNDSEIRYLSEMIYISVSDRITLSRVKYL
jgi:hypothetical protein